MKTPHLFLISGLFLTATVTAQAATLELPAKALGRWLGDCDFISAKGKSSQPLLVLKANATAFLGTVFYTREECQGKSWIEGKNMSLHVDSLDEKGGVIAVSAKKPDMYGYIGSRIELDFSANEKIMGVGFTEVETREVMEDSRGHERIGKRNYWDAVQYESFPYAKK
jgi:hypothetical protein